MSPAAPPAARQVLQVPQLGDQANVFALAVMCPASTLLGLRHRRKDQNVPRDAGGWCTAPGAPSTMPPLGQELCSARPQEVRGCVFMGFWGPVAKIKRNEALQITGRKDVKHFVCNSQSKAISHLQQEIENCGVISCKERGAPNSPWQRRKMLPL